jgi:hypothetical protein
MNITHNAFTENLDTDWVAISPTGVPISRASSKEAVERAAPGSTYLTGKDFETGKDSKQAAAAAAEKAEAEKAEAEKAITDKPSRQRKPASE